MKDYKYQALEKQQSNKYDNKKRKAEELKDKRINVRASKKYYEKFMAMTKESGLKQSEIFEQLLDRGYVQNIVGGNELAKNLCEINDKLNHIQETVYLYKDCPDRTKLIDEFRDIKLSYEFIKNILWESFKNGVTNGYIKN